MLLAAILKFLPYFLLLIALGLAVGFSAALLQRKHRPLINHRIEPSAHRTKEDLWGRGEEGDRYPERKRLLDGAVATSSLDTARLSLDLLRALEWKRFELVCAAYFEALGFTARTARAGADGGVDIHLFAKGVQKPEIIVQCKAWNTYKVGIKPIRELFGVMAREQVAEGVFVTTGEFTAEARSFPKANELHLLDGEDLLKKILALPEDQQAALLSVATEGDFTTPTCPSCAIKMIRRENKKNNTSFWGCSNYPRCRQTFKYSEN